ncbi:MAG: glucose 1-dehydrogenase [Chthoniobacterales bacterium]
MTDPTEPTLVDPRTRYPQPPYPSKAQKPPGLASAMDPPADHGETSYVGNNRLAGLTALVTGGDSGIGRAVAIAFGREGANVLISYLNEEEDALETEKWVREAGVDAISVAGDIADPAHCRKLVETCVSEFGGIDILVNNAAHQRTKESVEEFDTDDFERTFRVNVFGMFNLCKAAMEHMKPGGSIVNTASIQAQDPSGPLLAYASSKGAIITFTRGLADLAIEQGIRVNAVAPGPIWTPLIPATMPQEKVEGFGGDTPIGRAGQPAELAPTFVLLASKESSYITGEVIAVTGGRLM